MDKFIQVHTNGCPRLINLRWVEEIWDNGKDGVRIYFAFNCPDACEQDNYIVDESYEEILRMIWR